jgi:ferredoxin
MNFIRGLQIAFIAPSIMVSSFHSPRSWNKYIPTFDLASSSFVDLDSSEALRRVPSVDMNQYNLPIERIMEEWTAKIVAKGANTEGGIFLFAKNHREVRVDTIQFSFPRRPESGMGIILQEIAGGREDGIGITLVSDISEDGPAFNCGIIPGDSIVKVTVLSKEIEQGFGGGVSTREMEESVDTECLGFDASVAAILKLPLMRSDDEIYVVTVKRLRRKPKVTVKLQYPPSQGEPDKVLELFSGEILRQAMLARGVRLNDPLAERFDDKLSGNCGANGLCTTCAVSVLRGGELLNPMRPQERQIMIKLSQNSRWRLACKTVVGYGMQEGELIIRVNPRQWNY